MKIGLCESLWHRSADNYILACRHNRREDEILEKKFALYQRQIRVVDHTLQMAEHRFEKHIKDDLDLMISYRHKALEASENHQFYYPSTNKNWTTKIYSVQPLFNPLERKSLYEYAFERRSRQYAEELKQKTRLQRTRKEHFMSETISLIRDDYQKNNDWPLSEYARIKLPSIHQSKSNYLPKIQFSIEI